MTKTANAPKPLISGAQSRPNQIEDCVSSISVLSRCERRLNPILVSSLPKIVHQCRNHPFGMNGSISRSPTMPTEFKGVRWTGLALKVRQGAR